MISLAVTKKKNRTFPGVQLFTGCVNDDPQQLKFWPLLNIWGGSLHNKDLDYYIIKEKQAYFMLAPLINPLFLYIERVVHMAEI